MPVTPQSAVGLLQAVEEAVTLPRDVTEGKAPRLTPPRYTRPFHRSVTSCHGVVQNLNAVPVCCDYNRSGIHAFSTALNLEQNAIWAIRQLTYHSTFVRKTRASKARHICAKSRPAIKLAEVANDVEFQLHCSFRWS